MDNLKARLDALQEAAERGPWSYRPDKYDDWGMIRGGEIETDIGLIRPPVAKAVNLWTDRKSMDDHRSDGTDPCEPNGQLITALVNSYRSGDIITRDEANKMVRDALGEAAYQASNACLVPPDGGSPTEEEANVCDVAAERIRALIAKYGETE